MPAQIERAENHVMPSVPKKPKPKKREWELFFMDKATGLFWCHIGYGEWALRPREDGSVRHMLGLCSIDEKYRRGREWALRHWRDSRGKPVNRPEPRKPLVKPRELELF